MQNITQHIDKLTRVRIGEQMYICTAVNPSALIGETAT